MLQIKDPSMKQGRATGTDTKSVFQHGLITLLPRQADLCKYNLFTFMFDNTFDIINLRNWCQTPKFDSLSCTYMCIPPMFSLCELLLNTISSRENGLRQHTYVCHKDQHWSPTVLLLISVSDIYTQSQHYHPSYSSIELCYTYTYTHNFVKHRCICHHCHINRCNGAF